MIVPFSDEQSFSEAKRAVHAWGVGVRYGEGTVVHTHYGEPETQRFSALFMYNTSAAIWGLSIERLTYSFIALAQFPRVTPETLEFCVASLLAICVQCIP